MRLALPLALGLLVGACSSSPEWVSSASGSLCTYDVSARAWGSPVDVVIVVDDSPSAAPSRSMLRTRTLDALRRLVTEPVPNDWMGLPALHDLHVLVRGVPGEGWYVQNDWCRLRFTAWAEPVGGSFILLHCTGPKCGP